MVAALEVRVDTAGSTGNPTSAAVPAVSTDSPASIRFKTADDNTINIQNPIPIPQGNTINNSYWKSLYIACTTAPDTSITNFRMYTDGTGFGSGITVNIGSQYPVRNSGSTASYQPATGNQGTSGTEMVTGHSGISSVRNLFDFTTGSRLTLADSDFISEADNIINAANETTNYFILQARVAASATPGTKGAETITIVYDEV